jgi:hypothetical protein
MMEAVNTFETLVAFYETARRDSPEEAITTLVTVRT